MTHCESTELRFFNRLGLHRVHVEFMNGHLPLDCTQPSFSSPENAASDWVPASFPSTVAIPGARIRD